MPKAAEIRIGTAGWSIPRASAARFPSAGTHLQLYSRYLRCAEINSSFHRPHAATTYAKWRDSTPADFRFAVKMPRTITHELKLQDAREPFAAFLTQTDGLAQKRGPLLMQLPPSLVFDVAVVSKFLDVVRTAYAGVVVCEPRHATWFSSSATSLLLHYRIARAGVDPAALPTAAVPAGWPGVAYFRLHGSPRKYWSRYDGNYIAGLALTLQNTRTTQGVWCVFDNTASGAALENACELRALLNRSDLSTPTSTAIAASPMDVDEERLMPPPSQARRPTFRQLVERKGSDEPVQGRKRESERKRVEKRAGTGANGLRAPKSQRQKQPARKG